MIRTKHTCETSRKFEKMYKAQCIITDHYKPTEGIKMKDSHEVKTQSVNEIAQQIDSMIDREEKAQKERIAQWDKIEKEIGDGVFKLSELQDLARKHAALLPF
mgnify:CR=1 FL=1